MVQITSRSKCVYLKKAAGTKNQNTNTHPTTIHNVCCKGITLGPYAQTESHPPRPGIPAPASPLPNTLRASFMPCLEETKYIMVNGSVYRHTQAAGVCMCIYGVYI